VFVLCFVLMYACMLNLVCMCLVSLILLFCCQLA